MLPQSFLDPVAASGALADLAAASGHDLGGVNLRPPVGGEIPLDPQGWLVHAAEEIGFDLDVAEAGPRVVAEWLGRDLPALTVLPTRADEAEDGEGEAGQRWLVLDYVGDGRVRATFHGRGTAETLEVPLEDFAAALGLDEDERLQWVTPKTQAALAGSAGGKPGPAPHPFKRLLTLLRPDRADVLSVVIFAMAIGVLLLATPIAVQAIVNFVAQAGNVQPLIVVVASLFLGLAFAGLLSAMQTWVVELLQRRIFVRAVSDFAARLPRAALGNERHVPELVNRYFDIATIQKTGSFLLLDGLSVLLSVLVGLSVLAFYHPLLLAFDVILLFLIGLIILGPVRSGIRTAKAESSAKYEVAAWLEQIAGNPVLFKSSGVMKSVFERTDRLARTYIERRAIHFKIAFGQGVAAILLQVLASTALLGIGGFLVMQGSLTLGQLVAAEIILTLVVTSVAKMGKHLEAFYDLMAATDKVGMVLDVEVERSEGEQHLRVEDPRGTEVELRSVSWAPPRGGALLKDLSLKIEPGERVGVSGPSGSGKSTLLQLIWGLRTVGSGAVRIDGRDLRELALDSVRRTASLIDGVEIIGGTARENVELERPFVTEGDVRDALRRVGLLDDLDRLPDGVSTQISPSGRPLSAGQLARVQLARAIASRPRLLLVSDLFEGLDAVEREAIFDVLFDEDASWTLVLASNRPEVLGRCDRAFQLEQGTLAPLTDPSTSA